MRLLPYKVITKQVGFCSIHIVNEQSVNEWMNARLKYPDIKTPKDPQNTVFHKPRNH